jgi:antitoxin ParD1/3/4
MTDIWFIYCHKSCQSLTFHSAGDTLLITDTASTPEEILMDQMNVSITDHLAGYVRARVKSGRYNNASEVVREALRHMEEADERALRIAAPTVEDVLTDFTALQTDRIRRRVLEGIGELERGEYTVYEGRAGLAKLSAGVKARGRKLLAEAEAK